MNEKIHIASCAIILLLKIIPYLTKLLKTNEEENDVIVVFLVTVVFLVINLAYSILSSSY